MSIYLSFDDNKSNYTTLTLSEKNFCYRKENFLVISCIGLGALGTAGLIGSGLLLAGFTASLINPLTLIAAGIGGLIVLVSIAALKELKVKSQSKDEKADGKSLVAAKSEKLDKPKVEYDEKIRKFKLTIGNETFEGSSKGSLLKNCLRKKFKAQPLKFSVKRKNINLNLFTYVVITQTKTGEASGQQTNTAIANSSTSDPLKQVEEFLNNHDIKYSSKSTSPFNKISEPHIAIDANY